MDADTFYDALDWMNFEDRLEFIKIAEYDLSMDDRPETILRYFYDLRTFEDAMSVAGVFRERIGLVVLCRYSTKESCHFKTIMDLLDDCPIRQFIKDAFIRIGFLYAEECDPRELCTLHCLDPYYAAFIEYDYEMLKELNAKINEELQQYLFTPQRIQQWIESGHALEDYMS